MQSTAHITQSNIHIGTVVSLKSHPFFTEKDPTSIFIGGEANALPPMMVVTETIKEGRSSFDESSGLEVVAKGSYQCKCVWFSTKSFQFEEVWISSIHLRTIKTFHSNRDQNLTVGSSLILCTATIEISKKRSSLKQQGIADEQRNKSISGLLTFTSPILHVVGILRNETKPTFNTKTGEQRKVVSAALVKCKYYNAHSDKFSEVILPAEALVDIQSLPFEKIKLVENAISNCTRLFSNSPNIRFNRTIIKPLSVVYKLGTYYVEAYDYLQNKVCEVPINSDMDQFTSVPELIHLPRFEENGDRLDILPITKISLQRLDPRKFWRIKYKDNTGAQTVRTIYDVSYFHSMEISNNPESEDTRVRVEYIKATCILKNHKERYFRIDRIQTLKVLDLHKIETLRPEESIA
jgi:hypothetical protein